MIVKKVLAGHTPTCIMVLLVLSFSLQINCSFKTKQEIQICKVRASNLQEKPPNKILNYYKVHSSGNRSSVYNTLYLNIKEEFAICHIFQKSQRVQYP